MALPADAIGYVAATLTTLSFVPQAFHVIRTRDTRAISTAAYIALGTGVALWLVYGVALGEEPIIVANAVTLALALVILGYKLRLG